MTKRLSHLHVARTDGKNRSHAVMITCVITYEVEPTKLREFEAYAERWVPLVEAFGGRHHGYFLPHEGANDVALALFSFPSLAAYEKYRIDSMNDPACREAYEFAAKTNCIRRYDRTFMRPMTDAMPAVLASDAGSQGRETS